MSQHVFSKPGSRRLAVLASACALAGAGGLALAGTASASGAARTTSASSCSDATLNGTYTYAYEGWSVAKGASTPSATSGFDHFNGAGTSTGVTTFVANGVVENNNTPDSATYALNANCTGTIVFNIAGSLAHFNIYASPSGKSFSIIQTDPGSVQAGTETRVN
jgi:hypothetical protein